MVLDIQGKGQGTALSWFILLRKQQRKHQENALCQVTDGLWHLLEGDGISNGHHTVETEWEVEIHTLREGLQCI